MENNLFAGFDAADKTLITDQGISIVNDDRGEGISF
jgi:hypothetical protein